MTRAATVIQKVDAVALKAQTALSTSINTKVQAFFPQRRVNAEFLLVFKYRLRLCSHLAFLRCRCLFYIIILRTKPGFQKSPEHVFFCNVERLFKFNFSEKKRPTSSDSLTADQ